ncbi:MAG: hypothetical protein HY597_04280 [Candidatus Omnitrophica bacterium]|nr:hypothetical protein [Candidatus Omnitrophota bacterium]
MARACGKQRGQSTAEYAILIAVVIAAFLGLAILLKNAIQGGGMDRARQIGQRFSPTDTVSTLTTTANTHRFEETFPTGETTSTSAEDEKTTFATDSTVSENVKGPLF